MAEELSKQVSVASELLAEHQWARAGEIIEEKEKELVECIALNYSRIKGVERELAGLQLQLKLTSGPKKSALELLRKKIEFQNDKVVLARGKYHTARKIAEDAKDNLKAEEGVKEQLCQELNLLVQQSAHAQLERLEQLTQRMEQLNKGFIPDADLSVDQSGTKIASENQRQHHSDPSPQASSKSVESPKKADAGDAPMQLSPKAESQSVKANLPKPNRESSNQRFSKDAAGQTPRRPEMRSEDQQMAAAARGRHVTLNAARPRSPSPSVTPVGTVQSSSKPGIFRGFE